MNTAVSLFVLIAFIGCIVVLMRPDEWGSNFNPQPTYKKPPPPPPSPAVTRTDMTNTAVHTRIAAALEGPEAGVPEPTPPRKSSSFSAQVSDLAAGETAPRLTKIDPSLTVAEIKEKLPALRDAARNNVSSAVRSAKQLHDGSNYTVEVTDFTTPRGEWFVIALVTRDA